VIEPILTVNVDRKNDVISFNFMHSAAWPAVILRMRVIWVWIILDCMALDGIPNAPGGSARV